MPAQTSLYALPYPLQTDPVDVSTDIYLLANQVDGQLNLKANLASPALTGTPTSTTAAVDTNTTQIATTAFVVGQGYLKSSTASSTYAPLASPNFTGTPQISGVNIATASTVSSAIVSHGSVSSAIHGVTGSVVGTTDTQTLTNKTISGGTLSGTFTSTATISGGDLFKNRMIAPIEKWNISATAVTAITTINYLTAQNWYYTTASTAGTCAVNIIGDGSTSLSSLLSVGESVTLSFAITTGATTPAFFNSVQVDGTVTGVTLRWQYGTTPTTGTTSGVDVYSFTVVKTAATPTYTVFASVVKW